MTMTYSKYHNNAAEDFHHETEEHGRLVLRFGRHWCARLVRKGESYGLRDCLEHTDDRPTVDIFDASDRDTPRFGPLGQFVSRYYASTLLAGADGFGLDLHGGVLRWTLNADEMRQLREWLRRVTSE